MAQITYTAADVRKLEGAVSRKAQAAESMTVGDAVYVSGASGNIPSISKTVGTAVATSNMFGVVIAGAPQKNGSTTIASGDVVDVVVYGPVSGFSGTAGAFAWVGDTAGQITDAVGTKSCIAGFMESASVLFVRPMQAVRSA